MTKAPKTPKTPKMSKSGKAAKVAKTEKPAIAAKGPAEASSHSTADKLRAGTDKLATGKQMPPPPSYTKKEIDNEEGGMFRSQLLFILILAFFVITVFWASTAELDKQVRAEGAIIPPSDVQIVQARLPGLVTEISVELGSLVKQGDVMF